MNFSKEEHDVSLIFLAYLTFLGNCTKVGLALKMRPEVVEVLAAKENWEAKLKTYVGLRHEKRLAATDGAIRRTVTFIQACHLRDLIGRLIDHFFKCTSIENVADLFSPRNPRTNKPRFSPKILLDLCKAFHVATRIVNRTSLENPESQPEEEGLSEKERLQIREAIARAMSAADHLPGVDSVALAVESLAKWSDPEKEEST